MRGSTRRWPDGRSPITGRGSTTSAREKPYQLDDKLERLFHEKSVTGRGAWNRLFDETIAALRFEVDGEELTLEPTLNLLQDPREDMRREAAEALAATLKANLRLFTLITNTLAKDKEISDRWRGFADVADSRHLANRVEREVVDALVARGRRRLSAPLAPLLRAEGEMVRQGRSSTIGTATRRCPTSPHKVYPLGRGARHGARRPMPASRRAWPTSRSASSTTSWIDAPVRPGKAPGAFAHPTVPSAHPYVLLNYQGKPRDVMTLAHELGHGVHQVLAAPNGALMAPTPLTLAETASVFGEMLTFRALLATAEPAARRAMLAAKVEDMLNTVVRQIAFYSLRAQAPYRAPRGRADRRRDLRALDGRAGREPRAGDQARRPATRPSGPISRTSSIRPSTSTPMPSAIAW